MVRWAKLPDTVYQGWPTAAAAGVGADAAVNPIVGSCCCCPLGTDNRRREG